MNTRRPHPNGANIWRRATECGVTTEGSNVLDTHLQVDYHWTIFLSLGGFI